MSGRQTVSRNTVAGKHMEEPTTARMKTTAQLGAHLPWEPQKC